MNSQSARKDVFVRCHVAELALKDKPVSGYNEPVWPDFALVFDTETTLDPRTQELLFGLYRVCQLRGNQYECVEEGIVYADDLPGSAIATIERFVRDNGSEVTSADNDERIHIYSRSDFVEHVFFEAVRTRSLIVAFNAPFDISRLAVDFTTARNRAWTLILSHRTSRNTGLRERNPERPCIRVTSKDSKSAFFSLTKPTHPQEWPLYKVGDKTRIVFRVLDLHTLGWALFNKQFSLKTACKELHTANAKFDHEPAGTVTGEELSYCRQDVRCTVDLLNALKNEFDKHPVNKYGIELYPDRAVSPASLGKAYMRTMGIVPPAQKFDVPDYINGIAAQAYFGGRAECRIRNTPVPVMLTDFSSQYPTINSLLGNPKVLAAKSLTFEDTTNEVRRFVRDITLEDCFNPRAWKQMKFFALVYPEGHVCPVRAEYDETTQTKNIGMNHFTSAEPIWMSGPDVIAMKLLSDNKPIRIEKAFRMIAHGTQSSLRKTNLRGMVEVDPRTDDLFQVMVEQKQVFKESDPALSYFLKICANSTSYGMFFELTPQKRFKPVRVKVFSGEHSHEQTVTTIEKPGEWYFPPIAALITGGAHLFLAMLERCITDQGGHYLFCDTDSMCIVASRNGGWVPCPGEPRIRALSRKQVQEIAARFESLNCYNKTHVPGSILKIEKVNFHKGKPIDLFGYAISAKRYALYRYDVKGNLVIVDAKAHGLGYLFPPIDNNPDDPETDWIRQCWSWILQGEVSNAKGAPKWFSLPAMMRITVSTPSVLGMLKGFTRPFNFVNVPLLFPSLSQANTKLSLVMGYSKNRQQWICAKAFDARTGNEFEICLLGDNDNGRKIEVKSFGNILVAYKDHPESKFVGQDGLSCTNMTRGLLRRAHVLASRYRYIGKETSRRWEQGDDVSMVDFVATDYGDGKIAADSELIDRIRKHGIRKTAADTGLDSKTVMLIARGGRVKVGTLEIVLRYV